MLEIIGYISYAFLVFQAFSWTLGVRLKDDIILGTVLAALFYLSAAIIL